MFDFLFFAKINALILLKIPDVWFINGFEINALISQFETINALISVGGQKVELEINAR